MATGRDGCFLGAAPGVVLVTQMPEDHSIPFLAAETGATDRRSFRESEEEVEATEETLLSRRLGQVAPGGELAKLPGSRQGKKKTRIQKRQPCSVPSACLQPGKVALAQGVHVAKAALA